MAEKRPKMTRKKRIVIILASILLLLGAGGAAAYYFKWYQPVLDRYNAATAVIKVKEGDTFAIEGATVEVKGVSHTTDANGRVSFPLVAGTYEVTVTKDGYQDFSGTLTFTRGSNDVQYIALTKMPDKVYAVKGFVQDYVSGQALAGVSVTLGSKTVQTDPSGAYAFEKVAPATVKVALSKQGYLDKELPLTVVDSDITTAKVPLVPSGRTVFVSNRDGKRALYSANYDGTDSRVFVEPKDGSEEFGALVAPSTTAIAFSTTRDGQKKGDGTVLARLYLSSLDGKTLTKVSDDLNTSFSTAFWSPNSAFFYFSGFSDTALSKATYKVYSLAKNSVVDIGEIAVYPTFSPDSSLLAYTVTSAEDKSTTETAADGSTSTTISKIYMTSLKTLNLKTGERKTLAKREAAISVLQFAADSNAISYETVVDGSRKRFSVKISDGSETAVNLVPEDKRAYSFSPDGKSKAFVETRDGKTDLYVVGIDGKNEKRLTTLGYLTTTFLPVWDDGGIYLTVGVQRESETALYITGINGGEPKKITDYYNPS